LTVEVLNAVWQGSSVDENPVISVTGFTEAADKSYDFVQEGKVYYLSKASVVLANKRFSALPNE
jgi:replication factor A1